MVSALPRSFGARVGAFVVALISLVVLAGCKLDVSVDVTMVDDGSGTVTVVATADSELLAKAPGALADLRLDDVKQAGWMVTGPKLSAGGGQQLELRKTFATPAQATIILGEISGSSGPLSALTVELERTFARERSTVTGEAGLDGGLAAFSDSALNALLGTNEPLAGLAPTDPADGLVLTVTAHLPGKVTASNGKIASDRTSVTWTPDLHASSRSTLEASFEKIDLVARNARKSARIARLTALLYGGLIVAVLAAIAIWVGAERRRARRRRSTGVGGRGPA